MTAEVAIINRSGIAVAADSAATIGRKRVWKSADKLFSLGPSHDVGVMFYGSADLFGCHWEIIIKQFREAVVNEPFNTTEEVSKRFQEFISSQEWMDETSMEIAGAHLIAACIERIKSEVDYESAMQFRTAVKDKAKELITDLQDDKGHIISIAKLTKSQFSVAYRPLIKKFSLEIFKQKIVSQVLDAIEGYIFEFFRRANCKSGFETGIVIFGYGSADKYPSIYEIMVDGACCGNLRLWNLRSKNLNTDETRGGLIPFAQTDVASLFMEGISSIYISFFMAAFEGALSSKDSSFIKEYVPLADQLVEEQLRDRENEQILKELSRAFTTLRQKELIKPIVESIHSLPRDEMAAMAEAFVEITSMRRKFDSHLDTVGGAVDVAVVSKGEGLVWIKRKAYFDAGQNPDYFERKRHRLSRRDDNGR